MDQGRDLNDMISPVLESGLPAGKLKAVIYSRSSSFLEGDAFCWSAAALKK